MILYIEKYSTCFSKMPQEGVKELLETLSKDASKAAAKKKRPAPIEDMDEVIENFLGKPKPRPSKRTMWSQWRYEACLENALEKPTEYAAKVASRRTTSSTVAT